MLLCIMTVYSDFIKQYAKDYNLTYRQAQKEVKQDNDFKISKSISKKILERKPIEKKNIDLNTIKFISNFQKLGEKYKKGIIYTDISGVFSNIMLQYLVKKYNSINCNKNLYYSLTIDFRECEDYTIDIFLKYKKRVFYSIVKML